MSRRIDLVHQWTCEPLTPQQESTLAALLMLEDAESQKAFELLRIEAMLRAEHLELDVAASVVDKIEQREADGTSKKVLDRIAEKKVANRLAERPGRGRSLRAFAAAAAVLLVIGGVCWTILGPARQQDQLVAEGTVKIETAEGLVDYDGKGQLPLGAKVSTGENSSARARLSDGTDIELASRTVVAVTRDESAVGVELAEGRIVAQVAKQPPGKRFAVHTPNLTVEVVGTRFSVAHDAGVSKVTVEEGAVDVVWPQSGRRERLAAGEDLTASESGVLAGPTEEYWREDFESPQLAEWWSDGRRINTSEAPPGNESRGCLKAAESRDTYHGRNILVARMANERSGLLKCDDSLVVRFKYHASPSCGWIGIWMQAASGKKYYLPVKATLGGWQTAEVRLMEATSTAGDRQEPMLAGEVVQVLTFQAGRTGPDSAFYLDDLSINRVPPR